uniref:Uncharacterized protein n=1 Tax=Phlebotomus papatasi TaxID=29031 RepID=A0A1B0DHS7_PHLPP
MSINFPGMFRRFSVNFVIDDNNIPLHMRTEFGTSSSQDRLILNHKSNGSWQQEFTDFVSWTRPSQRFQVSFLFGRESIIIYENDSFLASFTGRLINFFFTSSLLLLSRTTGGSADPGGVLEAQTIELRDIIPELDCARFGDVELSRL